MFDNFDEYFKNLRPEYIHPAFQHYPTLNIGCAGLDYENQHKNIWEYFSNLTNSQKSYYILNLDDKIKSQDNSKVEEGFISRRWLDSTLYQHPHIIYAFVESEWETLELDNILSLLSHISSYCNRKSIPVILILIQNTPSMPSDGQSFAHHRMFNQLCQSSSYIFYNTCFAISMDLPSSAMPRIDSFIENIIITNCDHKISIYKSKRDMFANNPSKKSAVVRCTIKSAILYELKRNYIGALKNYVTAFNDISDIYNTYSDSIELKYMIGYLTCKLVTLYFQQSDALSGYNQFQKLINKFNKPAIAEECVGEGLRWLGHHCYTFAKLFENIVPDSQLKCNINLHPGYYFYTAAIYFHASFRYYETIKCTINPEDFKISPSSYLGKLPTIEYLDHSCSDNSYYFQLLALSQDQTRYNELIICCFESALAHYKVFPSPRRQLQILNRMIPYCRTTNDSFKLDLEIYHLSEKFCTNWKIYEHNTLCRLLLYFFRAKLLYECLCCALRLIELIIYQETTMEDSNYSFHLRELATFIFSFFKNEAISCPSFFPSEINVNIESNEISITKKINLHGRKFQIIHCVAYLAKSIIYHGCEIVVKMKSNLPDEIPFESVVSSITITFNECETHHEVLMLQIDSNAQTINRDYWRVFHCHIPIYPYPQGASVSISSVYVLCASFGESQLIFNFILNRDNVSILFDEMRKPLQITIPPMEAIKFSLNRHLFCLNEPSELYLMFENIANIDLDDIEITPSISHTALSQASYSITSREPSYCKDLCNFSLPTLPRFKSISIPINMTLHSLGDHDLNIQLKFKNKMISIIYEQTLNLSHLISCLFPISIELNTNPYNILCDDNIHVYFIISNICSHKIIIHQVKVEPPCKIFHDLQSLSLLPSSRIASLFSLPTKPQHGFFASIEVIISFEQENNLRVFNFELFSESTDVLDIEISTGKPSRSSKEPAIILTNITLQPILFKYTINSEYLDKVKEMSGVFYIYPKLSTTLDFCVVPRLFDNATAMVIEDQLKVYDVFNQINQKLDEYSKLS